MDEGGGEGLSDFKLSEKGMMLFTILTLTVLLVMLTTSMLLIVSQNLNITGSLENKAKALQAAEAGVDYALYQLNSDSTWGASITSDIAISLGSNQNFTIVFNPSSSYHSKNNLTNKDPNDGAPAYSATIISSGNYKGFQKVIRAIFVRDDEFSYPVTTGGDFFTRGCPGGTNALNSYGKGGPNDPARMHSNTNIDIGSLYTGSNMVMNLNGGFLSACSTVKLTNVISSVKKKTDVLPVKIPDIDITGIIARRPADPDVCKTLDPNTFYLAGYFEFDSNTPYCIPHHMIDLDSGDWWYDRDTPVHTSDYSNYKVGIISFTETDCSNFLSNYDAFYNFLTVYPWSADPDRNFYDYYNPITFYEYPISGTPADIDNFNNNLKNSLGLSMSVDTEAFGAPYSPQLRITLNLEKDLYIPYSTGLFQTSHISDSTGAYLRGSPMYKPGPVHGHGAVPSVRLNFAGHKIYADNKLWIGMPVYGTGAVVSSETIDFIQGGYDTNLVFLSDKSVRMVSCPEPYWPYDKPYTGIIYAKDDILIQAQTDSPSENHLIVKGSIVCKNNQPNNFEDSLLARYPLICDSIYGHSRDINCYIDGSSILAIDIIHSTDGLDTIASLRENDFKVRKQLCEVIK